MKELSPAEKLKLAVEANKKMIGKKVFVVSENAFGLVTDAFNEEELAVNFRGVNKRISIFDIRSVD